jgi:hypothetical protein
MRPLLALVIVGALLQPAAAAPRHARRHAAATSRSATPASTHASPADHRGHVGHVGHVGKKGRPHGGRLADSGPAPSALDVELKISSPLRSEPPPPLASSAPVATAAAPAVPSSAPSTPPPVVDLSPPSGPAPPPAMLPPSSPALTAPSPPAADRQRRWGLFAGGAAMLAGGYALDIGLSYGLGHPGAATSLIPIAGPLIQMGDKWNVVAKSNSGNAQVDQEANARIASVNSTIQTAAYCVLAVDAALQLAGATMAVVGVVGQRPARSYARGGKNLAFGLATSTHGLAVTF